jgi:hypothetical protein
MKRCTKCGQSKEAEQFPKNKIASDGLGSWCRACVAENSAAYFKTDRGRETLKKAQKRYFSTKKGKAALERGYRKLQKVGYFRHGKGGFLILRQGAVARGISFSLTEEEFAHWWQEVPDTCAYCGMSIERYRQLRDVILNYDGDDWEVKKFIRFYRSPKHKAIDWMTIDRADNSRGYELQNIVKACWICNSLKSDFFSPEEMRAVGPGVLSRLEHALNYDEKAEPSASPL